MFSGVRLRLSLLYLAVCLVLIAVVGATAYALMSRDFALTTDQALDGRMEGEFRRLGVAPPPELVTGREATEAPPRASSSPQRNGQGDGCLDLRTESYDPTMAATFALYLDAHGAPLPTCQASSPVLPPQQAAVLAALATGSDRRTVSIDGSDVRLLTYRVSGPEGVAAIQVGRGLADQQRSLRQLVLGLLALGGAAAALLGVGSWSLAGRTLRPTAEAWERQQVFVANASHELRAPLTLLRVSAEVVQRRLPPQAAESRALLDDVLAECDQLATLVSDLLLLSRLDAGVLQLSRESVSLPALLAEVGRGVGRLAEVRGVRLTVDRSPTGGDLDLWADPARLRQIVLILLDNALKHTPADGEVRVSARQVGRQVQLSVADTGCGIAPEALPHLFERFYRVDSARSESTNGQESTGLGLAIARALVTAHGGTIAIISSLGRGTTVTVALPAQAA